MSVPPTRPVKAGDPRAAAFRLWVRYLQQVEHSRRLGEELESLRRSRLWRLLDPLRQLRARLARPVDAGRPVLGPPGAPTEAGAELQFPLPHWEPMADAVPVQSRLLVDVTQLALEDLGAGVQRVTRHVLLELLIAPPAGVAVVPVRLARDGRHYTASRFAESLLGLSRNALGDECLIVAGQADRYLGLDFCREHAPALRSALQHLRTAGTPVAMVVHDLLPREHPEWFPDGVADEFSEWLDVLREYADTAVCISATTARAVRGLIAAGAARAMDVVAVPMGADALLCPDAVPRESILPGPLKLLVVGTVEPRKGLDSLLDAVEALRASGRALHLTIVGHPGWNVEALLARIRRLEREGDALVWRDHADDASLCELYRSCHLLVVPSHGEGYGLPIGEAATSGCRLLLRDLPVFREVAGPRARYFGDDGELLALLETAAGSLLDWPDPQGQPWPTWAESAAAMAKAAYRGRELPDRIMSGAGVSIAPDKETRT